MNHRALALSTNSLKDRMFDEVQKSHDMVAVQWMQQQCAVLASARETSVSEVGDK